MLMAVLKEVPAAGVLIRRLVEEENQGHVDVSERLKEAFPHLSRGLSPRTVRRYCAENGIHKTSRLEGCAVNRLVRTGIQKVCAIAWKGEVKMNEQ